MADIDEIERKTRSFFEKAQERMAEHEPFAGFATDALALGHMRFRQKLAVILQEPEPSWLNTVLEHMGLCARFEEPTGLPIPNGGDVTITWPKNADKLFKL